MKYRKSKVIEMIADCKKYSNLSMYSENLEIWKTYAETLSHKELARTARNYGLDITRKQIVIDEIYDKTILRTKKLKRII